MAHGRIANGRYDPAVMREVGAALLVPARGSACGTTRNRGARERLSPACGEKRRRYVVVSRGGFRGEYRARKQKVSAVSRDFSSGERRRRSTRLHPLRTARVTPFFFFFFSFLSFYPSPIDLISRPDNTTIHYFHARFLILYCSLSSRAIP